MNKPELNVYIGSMYAGKSSEIIKIFKTLNTSDVTSLVITHSLENRYDENYLSTHDNIKIPCEKLSKLKDIYSLKSFVNSSVILIDEAQFFEDILEAVNIVEIHQKIVYVFGLDGDFKRNKFGNILDLIPYCDNVHKLKSICYKCKSKGIFSLRISDSINQVLVGSNNDYQPVCRECYLFINNKKNM